MKDETLNQQKNTPKEIVRVGNMNVCIWSYTEGKLSVQKSWKKDDVWQHESINVFTSELPGMIAVLKEALNRMLGARK